VSHSLYFLAATWLAGQAGDARPMPQTGQAVIVESAPGGYVDGQGGWQQPQRRGLFSRIGGWFGGMFGRNNSGSPYYTSNGQIIQGNGQIMQGNGQIIQQPMMQQPAVQPRNTNEPPLAGGKVSMGSPFQANVVVSARVPLDQASPPAEQTQLDLPVADRFKDRLGHEADHTWLVGQLYRLGNMWVMRYAVAEEKDRHGGNVLLTTATDMQNFREGDLVSVQGQVINGGRHSEQIPCPVYRATEVSLVERGD
jgi:hypothetical protein